MARKKKKKIETGGGTFMASFADLMTLLLTFFILLYSMSSVDEAKFSAASSSIQGALVGEVSGGSILEGGDLNDGGTEEGSALSENAIPAEVVAMYEEAMKIIEQQGISEEVSVSSDQNGVYLDIQDSILFDPGQAEVSSSGEETLDSVVELLKVSDNDIIVEGHTDNVPTTGSQYPSNWELSSDRAINVVRYLSEENEIDPSRLSGRGYGEHSPVAPNDTAENRAENRRVNIVIVYEPEEVE